MNAVPRRVIIDVAPPPSRCRTAGAPPEPARSPPPVLLRRWVITTHAIERYALRIRPGADHREGAIVLRDASERAVNTGQRTFRGHVLWTVDNPDMVLITKHDPIFGAVLVTVLEPSEPWDDEPEPERTPAPRPPAEHPKAKSVRGIERQKAERAAAEARKRSEKERRTVQEAILEASKASDRARLLELMPKVDAGHAAAPTEPEKRKWIYLKRLIADALGRIAHDAAERERVDAYLRKMTGEQAAARAERKERHQAHVQRADQERAAQAARQQAHERIVAEQIAARIARGIPSHAELREEHARNPRCAWCSVAPAPAQTEAMWVRDEGRLGVCAPCAADMDHVHAELDGLQGLPARLNALTERRAG